MEEKEILCIVYSDLHLEIWRKFNEGNRRLKNGIDVIRQIKYKAKKLRVPIIFAGDLFHKEKGITNDLLSETLPKLHSLFSSGEVTYAITGNHDQSRQNIPGNESPSYIKTLSKIFRTLNCIDFETKDIDNVSFHGIPYLTHDIGLVPSIEKFEFKRGFKNVLVLHTTMPGARDTDNREIKSHIATDAFYKAIERFDLIITGHIHKPDTYSINGVQVIQAGAPQHQRFTDRNCDMGYWILYKDLTYKFVHLKDYPRFIEIEDLNNKPDNFNFYVQKEKRREIIKNNQQRKSNKFNNHLNRSKLAKNYCKEKSISDKSLKQALEIALKSTE